jgi:hypothetical protein
LTPKEGQHDMDQYRMPNALKKKRDASYRVGYTATTGNQTPGEPDLGKRSDLKN